MVLTKNKTESVKKIVASEKISPNDVIHDDVKIQQKPKVNKNAKIIADKEDNLPEPILSLAGVAKNLTVSKVLNTQKPHKSVKKTIAEQHETSPRLQRPNSEFFGEGIGPFRNGCCCNYFCNKRGLFTEIDMAFSNMMQLVPNSNVACRCCNKLFTPPTFQGRSCACLIRPRQRRPALYNSARGCSPERCGCNNHIWEDIYA